MNHNIFREYDIRGIVEEDFTNELVYDLGRSFGTFLLKNNSPHLSISGDIRSTTPLLKEQIVKGLLSTGVNVYDLGILPTPVKVPPVPTPETNTSTLPPVSSQISSAVVFICISGLAIFSNC